MRSFVRTSFADIVSRVSLLLLLVLCSVFILSGCQKRDEITSYTVKKLAPAPKRATAEPQTSSEDSSAQTPVDQGPPDRDRMLAAIVPHGKMAWFFKVAGPREAVGAKMEDFLSLLGSLKFAEGDDAPPEWTLPDGWTSEKGNGIRFATLRVKSSGEELETTVIPLPTPDPNAADYILSNVNRWCEQMGLPPRTKADLAAEESPKNAEIRRVDASGTMITLVNLIGRQKSDGMGAAPFAPFAGGKKAPPRAKSSEQPRNKAGKPQWTVPEGWKEGEGNQFSLAAFVVEQDGKLVKTTVSAAGGDLLDNVNRWRGQLQLDSWSKDELAKAMKSLPVDGIESPFVELIGTDPQMEKPACTLGVIVPQGDRAWFFKLTGDVGLAQREKANFEKFVQSVKFPK